MKQNIGIYIHIPFCKSKCYYCDFVSFANKEVYIEDYINSIIKEIKSIDLSKYSLKTIYIGGGTPSILESKYLGQVLNELKSYIDREAEITIEVNPGTVNKEKLKAYKQIGINRLSIGLQSTENDLLKQIGRIHRFEDFLETY